MKRRITLSIAIVLSVALVSLITSDLRVDAQNQIRVIADTGLIKIGPGQILRLTATPAGGINTVSFRRMEYMQTTCDGGVCKLAVASQSSTDPTLVGPGEAASIYMGGDTGTHEVRAVVLSNSKEVTVTGMLIDMASGNTVALYNPSSGFFF